MAAPSEVDLRTRVDALRFQFSHPGTDLPRFAATLRHRARSRRQAIAAITAITLLSTVALRRQLQPLDAVLYGVLALLFALGADRSRKEETAAAEVDWLHARLSNPS